MLLAFVIGDGLSADKVCSQVLSHKNTNHISHFCWQESSTCDQRKLTFGDYIIVVFVKFILVYHVQITIYVPHKGLHHYESCGGC